MAKKVKKKSSGAKRSTQHPIFEKHPNLRVLLYMFVLSVILWMLTYQLY